MRVLRADDDSRGTVLHFVWSSRRKKIIFEVDGYQGLAPGSCRALFIGKMAYIKSGDLAVTGTTIHK